jgi:hypothetical protein
MNTVSRLRAAQAEDLHAGRFGERPEPACLDIGQPPVHDRRGFHSNFGFHSIIDDNGWRSRIQGSSLAGRGQSRRPPFSVRTTRRWHIARAPCPGSPLPAGSPASGKHRRTGEAVAAAWPKLKEFAVDFDTVAIDEVLRSVLDLGLLSETERQELLFALTPEFPFADAVKMTESVHAHVKVTDTDLLPEQKLRALGYRPENGRPGYIRYSTDAKINLIFSSIPIADDDRITGAVTLAKPFMDHVGIDMRDESAPSRAMFDSIPGRASELGWREVTQAGPVHCCHTEVASKHWTYPPAGAGWRRPVEFAFGTLKVFTDEMGCDLRPIDPGHPLAGGPAPSCGGAASAKSAAVKPCGAAAEPAADVTAAS